MANRQCAIVNQRLYFCRLHIDWLQQEVQLQKLPRHIVEQSLGESVLCHLVLTYRAYLIELFEAYTSSSIKLVDATELIDQLALHNMHSAEAREMQLLEVHEDWLGQMLLQFESLGPVEAVRNASSSPQAIAFAEVDASSQDFSVERLQMYFDNLNALISHHRAHSQEW